MRKAYNLVFTLFLLVVATGASAQETSDSELDITGTWRADTPGGSFTVLSLPDYSETHDNIFLILDPGDESAEYGFRRGEPLAFLDFDGYRCWNAREKFRLPLWAGGNYYWGDTRYCPDGESLQFSTDDFSAVYDSYPLVRIADGIDAAGIWETELSGVYFQILLYPAEDGSWTGELLLFESDELDIDDEGIEPGQIFYRGEVPPSPGGEFAEAWVWGSDPGDESNWVRIAVYLEHGYNLDGIVPEDESYEDLLIENSVLRMEFDRGEELGTIPVIFDRVNIEE